MTNESSKVDLFLGAARFGHGDLWASVCDQFGLPPLGGDVLLGPTDTSGEVVRGSGRDGP